MNGLFEGVYEDVDKLQLNDDRDDDGGDTVGLQDLLNMEILPFNPEVCYWWRNVKWRNVITWHYNVNMLNERSTRSNLNCFKKLTLHTFK